MTRAVAMRVAVAATAEDALVNAAITVIIQTVAALRGTGHLLLLAAAPDIDGRAFSGFHAVARASVADANAHGLASTVVAIDGLFGPSVGPSARAAGKPSTGLAMFGGRRTGVADRLTTQGTQWIQVIAVDAEIAVDPVTIAILIDTDLAGSRVNNTGLRIGTATH